MEIYETFRKEQAKGFENLVGNPFTPDPRFLFRDMGSPTLDTPTSSQLLRNALTVVERQTGHTIENGALKPMLGAVPLGVLFLWFPQVYGVGYGSMVEALEGRMDLALMAILMVVKLVAVCLTLGSGFSGGIFEWRVTE